MTTSIPSSASLPSSASSPLPPAPSSPLDALVARAIQVLDAIEAELNLNIVLRPNDKAQMGALARVTSAALAHASEIVAAAPARFPDFAGLPRKAAYVQSMTPLAMRVRELSRHVDNSVRNQRAQASQETLVLYGVVKGLGRIDDNQTMREKVGALQREIAPKRPLARPAQTKAEKAAKRSAKALAARMEKAKTLLASRTGDRTPTPPSTDVTPISPSAN